MKKVLKYLDFTFLRFLPTLFLIILFYSIMRDELQALNRGVNYSLQKLFYGTLPTLTFLFLGVTSIFKRFDKTIKFSKYIQYAACAIALTTMVIYALEVVGILKFLFRLHESYDLFYLLYSLKDAIAFFAFLMIVISCFLKNKFFKTKWILAILSTVIFFAIYFCGALYMRSMYSAINLRMWFNAAFNFEFLVNCILFYFPIFATIILGSAPVKKDKVGTGALDCP